MVKGRILIIEDEAIVADDILFCLREAGHEVPLVCSSGEEALKALEKQLVDLVLVDILLAGEMDGIETALQLRKRFQLPVVYLTSFTNESIIERAKETTPSGYIVKPFKRRELLATVEMALYSGQIPPDSQYTAATLSGVNWMLNTLSKWLKDTLDLTENVEEALSGEIQKEFRKWRQQSRVLSDDLQYFTGLSQTDECSLDRICSLLDKMFNLQHSGRKLEFIRDPEIDSIRSAPLYLLEILMSALDLLALTAPENDLQLKEGAVPANKSNVVLPEINAEKKYSFQISIKDVRNSAKNTTLTMLESAPALSRIRDSMEKMGGMIILFSEESEGVIGFELYLP